MYTIVLKHAISQYYEPLNNGMIIPQTITMDQNEVNGNKTFAHNIKMRQHHLRLHCLKNYTIFEVFFIINKMKVFLCFEKSWSYWHIQDHSAYLFFMYYFFLLLSFTFRLNVFDTCICVVYRKLYSNNNQKMRIYGKKTYKVTVLCSLFLMLSGKLH